MVNSYELGGLDPYAFENLVNLLALRVLGSGASGFGPGKDGGRDGYFEGEAPYPSATDRWSGVWYIQSKFHAPHLSKDPHKWLIDKVAAEITKFKDEDGNRVWPNNWVIATNIDPSGQPETGSFDAIRTMVDDATDKKVKVAVWGGQKILGLLTQYPDVAQQYAHFITPGQVLASLKAQLDDQYASISTVIRYLVATQFSEQIYTKLDQAGSSSDTRPGVHHLFIDLPFSVDGSEIEGYALDHLCRASARPQRHSVVSQYPKVLREWSRNPHYARVALLKGGPGQGKSTVGQYFSQIQRAALLLMPSAPLITEKIKALAEEVEVEAKKIGAWPSAPRIPIFIELKEYAHWYGQRSNSDARGVLSYLANRIGSRVEQEVLPKTLRRALAVQSWFVLFDGLDEVPNDVKDPVADEVNNFVNEVVVQEDADVLTLCTSRPQGYSGQFTALDGPVLNLQKLDVETAILCAEPVVRFDRGEDEGTRSLELLKAAAASQSVRQLMTTPLQSHIMAVVVRDGGRPPERRWALFENFYQIMKKRESLKNVHNPRISRLLREDDRLLRVVHTRLGFVLHARAERSDGAQTTLTKDEFRELVKQVVAKLSDDDTNNTVEVVMEAMTERLVLVSTPENGAHVRFDIRQLQEFFAAEFLYDSVLPENLARRIEVLGGDSHWLEVMHFLLSALVENRRTTELDVTIKVLERLNEGDREGTHRLLYRRMAKGAILAMRLLIEGVLEQDKRDRLRFKPLFEPIGGVLDTPIIRNLQNVRAPNSKAWAINLLAEKLAEANNVESIGAIIALGWLLPDGHGLNHDLINRFLALSNQYQQVALQSWGAMDFDRYRARDSDQVSLWVLAGALRIAGEDVKWHELDSQSKKTLLSLLTTQEARLSLACDLAGLSPNISKLMSAVFDVKIRVEEDAASKQLGPVRVSMFVNNWTNGTLPPKVLASWEGCRDSETFGLFKIILAIVEFSQARDFVELERVLALIPSGQESLLSAVPPWLAALLPCRGGSAYQAYDLSHLRGMNSQAFEALMQEQDLSKYPPFVFRGLVFTGQDKDGTDAGWQELLEHLPQIAVHMLLTPEYVHFGITVAQRDQYRPMAEQVMLRSVSISKSYFLCWGDICERSPTTFNQIRELVGKSGCAGLEHVYGFSEVTPFPIEIGDGFSLCLLAKGLFQGVSYRHENEWSDSLSLLAKNIQKFKLTTADLKAVSMNHDYDIKTRIAGQLLGIVSLDSLSVKHRLLAAIEDVSPMLQSADEETATWYLIELCGLMQKELDERDLGAVSAAETFLNIAREKVQIRDALSQMLTVWRETSSSPVNATQSLQKWLDE